MQKKYFLIRTYSYLASDTPKVCLRIERYRASASGDGSSTSESSEVCPPSCCDNIQEICLRKFCQCLNRKKVQYKLRQNAKK